MLNFRDNKQMIDQLHKIYRTRKGEIVSRIREFQKFQPYKNDEEIFYELTFCILTPQSKAQCCWDAVLAIKQHNLLFNGTAEQIKRRLHRVRFHNKKAGYVVEARTLFTKGGRISITPLISKFTGSHEIREWLVKNIKGLGYKEASHFLRNIGLGEKIAILDRHILRNLHLLGVIEEIPDSLSRSKYLQIEERMAEFSRQVNIPLSHLDLLLWYKETGQIFK